MATTVRLSPQSKPRQISNGARKNSAAFVSLDGRLTVETWAKLPETKPHYELINGVLKQKMPTRHRHAHAANRLVFFLMLWGMEKGWQFYSEGSGLKADNYNGFVPDVTGFAPGVVLDPDAVYENSAFLAVEVASPSTVKEDRNAKMKGYARAEVEMYILIDSKKKIFEVYRLEDKSYGAPEVLRDDATWQPDEFPGFTLELAKLWM